MLCDSDHTLTGNRIFTESIDRALGPLSGTGTAPPATCALYISAITSYFVFILDVLVTWMKYPEICWILVTRSSPNQNEVFRYFEQNVRDHSLDYWARAMLARWRTNLGRLVRGMQRCDLFFQSRTKEYRGLPLCRTWQRLRSRDIAIKTKSAVDSTVRFLQIIWKDSCSTNLAWPQHNFPQARQGSSAVIIFPTFHWITNSQNIGGCCSLWNMRQTVTKEHVSKAMVFRSTLVFWKCGLCPLS
jgi:hypothetical protein